MGFVAYKVSPSATKIKRLPVTELTKNLMQNQCVAKQS